MMTQARKRILKFGTILVEFDEAFAGTANEATTAGHLGRVCDLSNLCTIAGNSALIITPLSLYRPQQCNSKTPIIMCINGGKF